MRNYIKPWHTVSVLFGLLGLLFVSKTATTGEQRQLLEFPGGAGLSSAHRLLLRGVNRHASPAILVIRLDDRHNPSYANRVNLERVLPPGPFELNISLGGLRTPNGRPLDPGALRRIIVFSGSADSPFDLEPPVIQAPSRLPGGALGWDLGPADSQLWPGFQALTPDFPGLRGHLKAIDRGSRKQASEGLTSDGIRGIQRLRLPLEPGRWRLSLWLRDPGEWEYLPHPLQRSISVDGRTLWSRHYSARNWINSVYLAGRDREATPGQDAWQLFGERPQGLVDFTVEVDNDGLELVFRGDQPEAGFVTAILAEPGDSRAVRDQIEAERARWWRNNWRIADWPQAGGAEPRLKARQELVPAAPDSNAFMDFELYPGEHAEAPLIELETPSRNGIELPANLRWGHWQLRRSGLSSTLLEPTDRHLRADPKIAAGGQGLPRSLHLHVEIPEKTLAGLYHGMLKVRLGDRLLTAPLLVDVAAVQLPPSDRPAGIYLERPVHFDWFQETADEAASAMACDLSFLQKLGLSGVAPPLPTPNTAETSRDFVQQVQTLTDQGFKSPYLAYAPFKRLLPGLDLEAALERLNRVQSDLLEQNLPLPIWSIADEPSNPGQNQDLQRITRYARTFAPTARLAGHLNNPEDRAYLALFDLVLLNAGFGVDLDDIQQAQDSGAQVWLYNLAKPRAAAGFYLWRVGAEGYLQWHGRMPTADPFDPTDGREDDVQLLPPMARACPPLHDIDRDLIEIAEGVTDLRWLLWLEQLATRDPRAAELVARLREEIPSEWEHMKSISEQQMDEWRRLIGTLHRE